MVFLKHRTERESVDKRKRKINFFSVEEFALELRKDETDSVSRCGSSGASLTRIGS